MPDRLPSTEMLTALKRSTGALRDAGVPFAVAGGTAIWAQGGPPSTHDVDLVLPEEEVERALEALSAAGMRVERPPEGWLAKAWDGEVLIDLIWDPFGLKVTPATVAGALEINVAGMPMPVLSATDVFTSKLLALSEGHLDFEGLLAMVRGVREQVDWPALRHRTAESPLARSFLFMVDQLDLTHQPFTRDDETAPVISMRGRR